MTLVAPRIVNSVSCVRRINHEIQAGCGVTVSWSDHGRISHRIGNDVSAVLRNEILESHFAWQALVF